MPDSIRARLLGSVWTNPARLNNKTCTVLIENCRLKHGTDFDHGEDLATQLVPVADISRLVAEENGARLVGDDTAALRGFQIGS
jgi:hypothetical protein